jgi:hypothetical protein
VRHFIYNDVLALGSYADLLESRAACNRSHRSVFPHIAQQSGRRRHILMGTKRLHRVHYLQELTSHMSCTYCFWSGRFRAGQRPLRMGRRRLIELAHQIKGAGGADTISMSCHIVGVLPYRRHPAASCQREICSLLSFSQEACRAISVPYPHFSIGDLFSQY